MGITKDRVNYFYEFAKSRVPGWPLVSTEYPTLIVLTSMLVSKL